MKSRITATLTAGTLNCAISSGTPSESGATATGCALTSGRERDEQDHQSQEAHKAPLTGPSYARLWHNPRRMRMTTFGIIALLGASLAAQAPEPLTFDPARAPIIDRALQRYVDTDKVAGIVALVMQDGKVVYEKAFGWADKEAGRRMTTDTIFRIASQTKALTSTAIMQLIEEGSLALSDAGGHA